MPTTRAREREREMLFNEYDIQHENNFLLTKVYIILSWRFGLLLIFKTDGLPRFPLFLRKWSVVPRLGLIIHPEIRLNEKDHQDFNYILCSFLSIQTSRHTTGYVILWWPTMSNNCVRVIMTVKVNAFWVSLVTWYYSRSCFKEHWRPFIFEFSSGNELCLKAVTAFDPFLPLTFTQSGHFCTYLVMSTKLSSMQLITNKK